MTETAIALLSPDVPLIKQIEGFDSIRAQSFRHVEDILHTNPAMKQVRLTGIDDAACTAWREQWSPWRAFDPYASNRSSDWPERIPKYRMLNGARALSTYPIGYNPGRFELAIWDGDVLCGLSCGGYKGELKREFLSVMITEGSPNPHHPLKKRISTITHAAACDYAEALGVKHIFYVGPFSPGTEKMANEFGFKHAQRKLTEFIVSDVLSVPVSPNSVTQFLRNTL